MADVAQKADQSIDGACMWWCTERAASPAGIFFV